MTTQEVEQWLDENFVRKTNEFGLPHWRFYVDVQDTPMDEGETKALTTFKDDYEYAEITLFAGNIADEEELTMVIEHELLHVHLAPTDVMIRNLPMEIRPYAIYLIERSVRSLERLLACVRRELDGYDN